MREMKDSGIAWIGVIPQDWEIVRTKSLYCSAKEIAGDRADDFERLALTLNGVIKRSKEDSVGLQPEKFSGYQILKKGELVFKLIDLENVATSRVGLSPYTGIVSPAYIVLSKQSRAKDLVVRYSMYHFLSMWQREIFNQMGDNGVRSSLNTKELLNIPHPFPSVCEQKRIVTFLDAQCAEIDTVLEKTRASIEEYKKLKQAVITQAVTKGIRGDRPMKDSGIEWIGEIPAEWKVNLIKNVATTGSGGTPESGNPSLYDGDINWICSYDLKERPITKSKRRLTQLGADSIAGNVQLKGSVLVAMYGGSGTIGNSGILECEAKTNQAICSIKFNNGYITDYFGFYYILSIRKYWMLFAVGTRKDPNISQDIVRKMPCILPPIAEQEEIVAYCNKACDQLDTLITKKQQYLTEIENYKKSLIYEYVTGKREV